MTVQIIATYLAALCLIVGSGFALVGAIGLLKFNDPMTRLHAPTKVGTVGIGMLLLASMVHSLNTADPSLHEALIMAFLFVTAPISANFLAKVAIHRRRCDTPPDLEKDEKWSTLKVADTEAASR